MSLLSADNRLATAVLHAAFELGELKIKRFEACEHPASADTPWVLLRFRMSPSPCPHFTESPMPCQGHR